MRLAMNPVTGEASNGLTLCFAAKEKKQKSELNLMFHFHMSVLVLYQMFHFQNVSNVLRSKNFSDSLSKVSQIWFVFRSVPN